MFTVESSASHRGINAEYWIEWSDCPIRSKRQRRARIEQRTKRVSCFRSFVTNSFLSPAPIIDRVIWLHRSDDFVAPEAGDVLRPQMLCVLDAKASIAITVFLLHLFIDREDLVVSAIADRMNDDLQPRAIRPAHALEHRALGKHLGTRNAACVWRIVVRFEEESRRRAETAVGKTLQASGAQHRAAEVGAHAVAGEILPTRQRPNRIDARLQFAAIEQGLIAADVNAR